MADKPRPSPELLAQYAAQSNASKSLQYFGVTISFTADEVHADLAVKPEHLGGLGTNAVNGGVLSAMFDLAIGCTPALIDPTRRTATIQLSMSFERPVIGATLKVKSRIDKPGESVLFSSAVLYDAKGQACARCQGVVRVSKLAWASGASPAVN